MQKQLVEIKDKIRRLKKRREEIRAERLILMREIAKQKEEEDVQVIKKLRTAMKD